MALRVMELVDSCPITACSSSTMITAWCSRAIFILAMTCRPFT